ncbi:MAG: lytic transglycosylase domain-containing protein [Oligosphaeraceae bacterium]|jgi:soluble lytic murein transglycosylase|nr:lytic transglycosylase domain-containing protein [Oligosphaeraceae bacterium]
MARQHNLKLLCWLLIILVLGCAAAWKVCDVLRLRSLAQREKTFAPLAEAAAFRHGLNPALVKAVIWRESRWQPLVVGAHGEVGMMQITPGAVADWQRVNRKSAPARAELFQPELNIEIGTWYLAQAGRHWQDYRAKEILQLAEYNAGYGRVSKLWKPPQPDQEVPLEKISFPSTRDYIIQILSKKVDYEKL